MTTADPHIFFKWILDHNSHYTLNPELYPPKPFNRPTQARS